MAAGALKLAPLTTEIKVDLDKFREQMRQAGQEGTKGAEGITKNISSAAKVGDSLMKVGDTLTKE